MIQRSQQNGIKKVAEKVNPGNLMKQKSRTIQYTSVGLPDISEII